MSETKVEIGVGDLVAVRKPSIVCYGNGVVTGKSADAPGLRVESVAEFAGGPEWMGWFEAEELDLLWKRGSHTRKPGGGR